MNCQSGDLAITFGAPQDNGLLVEVGEAPSDVERIDVERWGQIWSVTSLGSPFQVDPGVFAQTVYWPDRLLKPMRPAGDDEPTQETRALPKDRERVTEGA